MESTETVNPIPPGWEVIMSMKHNKPYYYSKILDVSTWRITPELDAIALYHEELKKLRGRKNKATKSTNTPDPDIKDKFEITNTPPKVSIMAVSNSIKTDASHYQVQGLVPKVTASSGILNRVTVTSVGGIIGGVYQRVTPMRGIGVEPKSIPAMESLHGFPSDVTNKRISMTRNKELSVSEDPHHVLSGGELEKAATACIMSGHRRVLVTGNMTQLVALAAQIHKILDKDNNKKHLTIALTGAYKSTANSRQPDGDFNVGMAWSTLQMLQPEQDHGVYIVAHGQVMKFPNVIYDGSTGYIYATKPSTQ